MNKWRWWIWLSLLAMVPVAWSCSWPIQASNHSYAQREVEPPAPAAPSAETPAPSPGSVPSPAPLPSPGPSASPTPSPTPILSPQAWAARLRFTVPVAGAHVPEWLDLVPGAPRGYRSGIHEGVDFGYDAVGVTVSTGTRVVAAGDGVVVRADLDYRELSATEMDGLLARSKGIGTTPAADLDKLRGRQVWIDHGEGVVTRYAHLNAVAPGVAPGVRVSKGQLIAYVGSSGVPGEGAGDEPHLHFEIRLGEGYLGQGLPPARARELYVQALSGKN